MKVMGKILTLVLAFALTTMFLAGCWSAGEEEIKALEESKAAALAAQDAHSKKKAERQKLEADLAAKKTELEKVKAEKATVLQKLEAKKAAEAEIQ